MKQEMKKVGGMKTYDLKQLLTIKNGKDHKSLLDGNVPILGSGGIMRFGNKSLYNKPSILLPRKGSLHNIQFSKVPFWTVDTLYYTEINEKLVEPYFLFNYLKILDLENLNTGTGVPSMTFDSYYNLKISIPSLPTQQKIASVLSALDDKIELNNKINAQLELMAKTLYDYWFVQFDFPNENGKPYKSSGGKMIWNDVLKREIPEGWEVKSLGDLSDLVRGVSYSKDDIQSLPSTDTIPVLRATNITGNKIDVDNPVLVSKRLISEHQILNLYDILITMSSGSIDHIGKNGFFLLDDVVSFGAFCAKIVAKTNLKYYIYEYMQSEFVSNTIKNECLGTNINNMNSSMVSNFRIINPDNKIIDKFNLNVNPIYHKIQNNQKQNQQLSNLRDWLLPMLMNGQVSVE